MSYKDISEKDFINYFERVERALEIIELNKQKPMIIQKDKSQFKFKIRSTTDKDKFYEVDVDIKVCNCPDFNFRLIKCKHILAIEFVCLPQ